MNSLNNQEINRYSRQIALDTIGLKGQADLRRSHVGIIGLGGLGSLVAVQLAAMGVGSLRLIDRDTVSRTDLHRQYLYADDQVGAAKVDAAAVRLKQINPSVDVEPVATAISLRNAKKLTRDVDLLVDGLDNLQARYVLNRAALGDNKPFVFGGAIGNMGNVSTIIPHVSPCLECFYGNLEDRSLPTCAQVGVHPAILGMIGSIQVREVVALLTKHEAKLTGKLLLVDLDELTFDSIDVRKRDSCEACGVHPEPLRIQENLVTQDCSRDGTGIFSINPEEEIQLPISRLRQLAGDKMVNSSRSAVTFHYNKRVDISIFTSGMMIASVKPPPSDKDVESVIKIGKKLLSMLKV
jgi:adenylyltransferase/sulfurtransferase